MELMNTIDETVMLMVNEFSATLKDFVTDNTEYDLSGLSQNDIESVKQMKLGDTKFIAGFDIKRIK